MQRAYPQSKFDEKKYSMVHVTTQIALYHAVFVLSDIGLDITPSMVSDKSNCLPKI
jgi:hypothetical protein